MPMEFFNHAESEDGPLGRVVQHVQADDAGIEIAVIGGVRYAPPRNYMQEFTVTSSLDFDGARNRGSAARHSGSTPIIES